MVDMTKTIAAKSDQLNADDLIGGAITIKITSVNLLAGEQPVSIGYEGDGGKPWKPCKSMRRALVGIWGGDGNKYIGQYLTLYRDPAVTFGAQQVGGIRISHMSGIDKPVTMSLTAAKNSKKPFTVKPLVMDTPAEENEEEALRIAYDVAEMGTEALKRHWATLSKSLQRKLQPSMDAIKAVAVAADNTAAE